MVVVRVDTTLMHFVVTELEEQWTEPLYEEIATPRLFVDTLIFVD